MIKQRHTTFVLGSHRLSRIGLRRFDWRDPYYVALSLSWPSFFAAMLFLFGLINLIFAMLYMAEPGCVLNMRPHHFEDAFFFSLETIATVGYGVMAPASLYGHIISGIEIVGGMLISAITTGLVFVRFSKPHPRIIYAENAVIARHNGEPTLMMRIANGRMSLLTHTRVALYALLAEQSAEGRVYWRTFDLELQRSQLPFLAMSWTLMHTLDERSPLFGCTADILEKRRARLFITLEASDHTFGTSIQDVQEYDRDHIKFGMRFVDAVTVDDEGHAVADLTKVSLLEPDL